MLSENNTVNSGPETLAIKMGKFTDCFQKLLSLVCRIEVNVRALSNRQTYKLSKVTVTRTIKKRIKIKFTNPQCCII